MINFEAGLGRMGLKIFRENSDRKGPERPDLPNVAAPRSRVLDDRAILAQLKALEVMSPEQRLEVSLCLEHEQDSPKNPKDVDLSDPISRAVLKRFSK